MSSRKLEKEKRSGKVATDILERVQGNYIIYQSESGETAGILYEMGIKPPERILVGALPKSR